MRVFSTLFIILALLCCQSASRAADKAKLREAAKLPKVSLKAGFSFNAIIKLIVPDDKTSEGKTPDELRKTLMGTPEDADVYGQLAFIYWTEKNKDESQKCHDKAISLFRQQLKNRPQDPAVLAKLGRLLQFDHPEEAHTLLQRAVQLSPKYFDGWRAMALYHENRISLLVFGKGGDKTNIMQMMAFLQKRNLTAEEVQVVKNHIRELFKCCDHAVLHCPENAAAYAFRAHNTAIWNTMKPIITQTNSDPLLLYKSFTAPEVLKDLQQVIRLDPKNCPALGAAAMLEMFSAVAAGHAQSANDMWPNLPDASKKKVQDCIDKLEKLTHSEDRKLAADSAEILGLVYTMKVDIKNAASSYWRAVKLNPDNDQNWEWLIGMLGGAEDRDVLIAAKQWVQHKDSVTTRYLLAKAHDVFDNHAEAEKEIRAALKHDPKHFQANLGLAVMLMRRSDKDKTLAEAKEYLDRTKELVTRETPDGQRVELLVTYAIYFGLAGDERETADIIGTILRHQPGNEAAKRVQAALDSE